MSSPENDRPSAAEAAQAEIEWVVLRRFDDPFEAEITLNFLRDHDVCVAVRGNSVKTAMLNRFMTVIDIRLVVPAEEFEQAKEALAAMTSDATDQPFRGARPRELAPSLELERDLAPARLKSVAFVLALLVPVAGGHFYARHSGAAMILALGIVGGILGAVSGVPQLGIASLLLVATDALFSASAVRRYNERRIPSESKQRGWAFAAVVLAFLVAAFAAR